MLAQVQKGNRWLLWGLISSAAGALVGGCGSTDLFGPPGSDGTGGTGASTTTTTGTGTVGGGGSTATGTAGTGVGGGSGGAGGCQSEAVEVELADLDMFIMVDRSGSMSTDNRWTHLVTGMGNFVQEQRAPGTRVALNYHPDGGAPGTECVVANYTPPDVPLTDIPADGADLVADLGGQTVGGMSPWSSIVEGTLQSAVAQKGAEPEHEVVTVFIVDSNPNTCDPIVANVAAMAGAAFGSEGVRTFGIAFGGTDFNLVANVTEVASAGGTVQAYDLTAAGATANLQVALNDVYLRGAPCGYELPDPPQGGPLEPATVELRYTPGGGAPQIVPRVGSEASCSNSPGWYFDHAGSPERILLCPATCRAIKFDGAPLVEVVFHC